MEISSFASTCASSCFCFSLGTIASSGACVTSMALSSLGVMILEIVRVASSGVLFSSRLGFCYPFIFLFRGIKSFEARGRPCFRCVIDDSLASIIVVFPIGILILAGVFVAGIYDLVTLAVSVNASGNWLVIF